MFLYMSANPFIYTAFSQAAWLIAPTPLMEGKRKETERKCAALLAQRCVSVRWWLWVRVSVCVHWAVPDSPNTHSTEHQRVVCKSVCKQRWGCSERYSWTHAHTHAPLKQTDSLKFSPPTHSNPECLAILRKFYSYLEWRCSDLACDSPANKRNKSGRRECESHFTFLLKDQLLWGNISQKTHSVFGSFLTMEADLCVLTQFISTSQTYKQNALRTSLRETDLNCA